MDFKLTCETLLRYWSPDIRNSLNTGIYYKATVLPNLHSKWYINFSWKLQNSKWSLCKNKLQPSHNQITTYLGHALFNWLFILHACWFIFHIWTLRSDFQIPPPPFTHITKEDNLEDIKILTWFFLTIFCIRFCMTFPAIVSSHQMMKSDQTRLYKLRLPSKAHNSATIRPFVE